MLRVNAWGGAGGGCCPPPHPVLSPSAYLPEVEADDPEAVVGIEVGVRGVLRVVNLRVHPFALVVGVVNLSGSPLALRGVSEGVVRKGVTAPPSFQSLPLRRGGGRTLYSGF